MALVDFYMPEMNGNELAASLREEAPQMPVLILSSAAPTGRPDPGRPPTVQAVLWKPVRQEALYQAIAQALAAPVPPPPSTPSTLDASTALRHPLRILVAEDNQVNQRVVCGMLNGLGYQPDVVAHGVAVLEATARKPYDVILMDVQMPGLDGLETTRRLRRDRAGLPLRVVAMTANALAEEIRECAEAGMDDYIGKPFHGKQLAEVLERCHQALYANAP